MAIARTWLAEVWGRARPPDAESMRAEDMVRGKATLARRRGVRVLSHAPGEYDWKEAWSNGKETEAHRAERKMAKKPPIFPACQKKLKSKDHDQTVTSKSCKK